MKDPQQRRRLGMAGRLATAALLLLAISAPASAADDYKGWFGYLDLATTQPNSLDHHFANFIDYSGPSNVASRLTLDSDSDITYRVGVGYSFGDGLGALKVSYWSFDNDETTTGSLNGYVYPTLFGAGSYYTYGYGMYLSGYPVDFVAGSQIKASTIDIDYVRPIAKGEKVTLSWLAGLRSASWEEDQGFAMTDGGSDYSQEKHFESDGLGFRVGAGADFKFTDHFSIMSSMVFSFLQADTEGSSSQSFSIGSPPDDIKIADDDNIRGEIRDFDIKAIWSYGHLDYFLGYSVATWDGLVADPVPATDAYPGTGAGSRSRDGIAFNSIHGGVKWRFGKR